MGATGPRLPAKDRSSKDKDKSKSKKDKKDKNSQSQSQSAEGERKLGPDSGSGASLNNSGSGSSADLSKHIILSPVQIQVAALSSVDKSAGLAEMQSRYGLGGGGFLVPVYFQSAEGDKEHKSKSVKRTSGDGVKKASLKNPFNASWLSFAPHKR